MTDNRAQLRTVEAELGYLAAAERDITETVEAMIAASRRHLVNSGRMSGPQVTAYRQGLARLIRAHDQLATRAALLHDIALGLESE